MERNVSSALILPGDPAFIETLAFTPPPGWQERVDGDFRNQWVFRHNSMLMEPATPEEIAYMDWSGELEVDDDSDVRCAWGLDSTWGGNTIFI